MSRILLHSLCIVLVFFRLAVSEGHANEPVGKRLSAGPTQSLYVDPEGRLWGWGNVTDGKTRVTRPVKIMEDVKTVSASTGIGYAFALKKDNTLWGWGDNYFGQIVANTDEKTAYVSRPVKVMDKVRLVEAGNATVFAVKDDNTLWGWGAPGLRRGDLLPINTSVPAKVLDNVAMASASVSHTIAVDKNGVFWGWGDNRCVKRYKPFKVDLGALGGRKIVSIANTMGQTFVVTEDGRLWQWGADRKQHRACLSDETVKPARMKNIDNVKSISPGKDYLLILKKDGTVWSWNWIQQPLHETPQYRQIPLTGIIEIAAGDHHFLALKKDGTVWACGANNHGQLGNGTTRYSDVPVKVALPTPTGAINGRTVIDRFIPFSVAFGD